MEMYTRVCVSSVATYLLSCFPVEHLFCILLTIVYFNKDVHFYCV